MWVFYDKYGQKRAFVVGITQKVTTSLLSAGPPASPADGDIWIATAVDANGTRWHFQYNAGSASAYKWEFIGGAPLEAEIQTGENTNASAFTDLATSGPNLVIPRDGDYMFSWGANITNISGTTTAAGVALYYNLTGVLPNTGLNASPATNTYVSAHRMARVNGLTASYSVRLIYDVAFGGGTAQFSQRVISMIPIRIA